MVIFFFLTFFFWSVVSVWNCRKFVFINFLFCTLLNSLMNSYSFLVASLGFSVYHVICTQWQFYFFMFRCLLFLFLLWLSRPRLLKLCRIKVARVDILVLFLIPKEMLSGFFPPLSMMLAMRSSYIHSLYAYLLESCYHKRVLNFVKSFFRIYWDTHIVFILQFVNVLYHTEWFADIEKSLHPWDIPLGHGVWPF